MEIHSVLSKLNIKMSRQELIENDISVVTEAIRVRKVKLEELQEDIKLLESENEFDQKILYIRKEELSKLKRNN